MHCVVRDQLYSCWLILLKFGGRKSAESTAIKCSYNFYQFVNDVEEKNPKFFIFKKHLIVFDSVLY